MKDANAEIQKLKDRIKTWRKLVAEQALKLNRLEKVIEEFLETLKELEGQNSKLQDTLDKSCKKLKYQGKPENLPDVIQDTLNLFDEKLVELEMKKKD